MTHRHSVIRGAACAALLLCSVSIAPLAAEGADVSFLARQTTGDYGTGIEADHESFDLRVSFGDRTWFRADTGWVRNRSSLDILPTGLGSLPAPGAGERRGMSHGGETGMGHEGGSSSTEGAPAAADQWNTGPGDVWLTVGRRLVGGGSRVFRLDLQGTVKLPTADEEENLGTGETDFRLGASGEYSFWSASAFGGLGWNQLGDPAWAELDDVLDAYLGVESEPLADRWLLSGWIEGRQEVVAGTGDRTALGVGFRTLGRLRWRGQATLGLGGSAEDWSVAFGVSMGVEAPSVGRHGPLAVR